MTYHEGSRHADQPPRRQQAPEQRPEGREALPSWRAADLRALRSGYRVLRRVSTLTALGCFIVYVLLSCYAKDLMAARFPGGVTVGIALGLLQLVVTFAAVHWYERGARRSVDAPAARVAGRTDGQGSGADRRVRTGARTGRGARARAAR